ncbi:MAG: outer membrane beta-barrel protein [Planctomycetota bacterium]
MRLAVPFLAAAIFASCATTVPAPRRSGAGSLATSLANAPAVPLVKARERYLTVSVGGRSMIGNEWDPVKTPTVVGLTYDGRQLGQSFGLEAGGLISRDDSNKGGADIEATILEGFIGMRNTWGYDGSVMRPYWAIGGTVMRIRVNSDTPSVITDFDEDALGFYFRLGTRVQVSEGAALGIEYRFVRGASLSNFGADANYGQIMLNFGWAF